MSQRAIHRVSIATLSIALAGSVAAAELRVPRGPPVLADGRCDTAEYAKAARERLSDAVELLALRYGEFVALCLRYTPAQANGVDLYIADGHGRLHNLHASAMLGQRERGADGWPDWTWWNNRDWSANPVRPRDFRTLAFEPSEATEFVVRRTAFAAPWRIRIDVHTREPVVVWPTSSSADDPKDWIALRY